MSAPAPRSSDLWMIPAVLGAALLLAVLVGGGLVGGFYMGYAAATRRFLAQTYVPPVPIPTAPSAPGR